METFLPLSSLLSSYSEPASVSVCKLSTNYLSSVGYILVISIKTGQVRNPFIRPNCYFNLIGNRYNNLANTSLLCSCYGFISISIIIMFFFFSIRKYLFQRQNFYVNLSSLRAFLDHAILLLQVSERAYHFVPPYHGVWIFYVCTSICLFDTLRKTIRQTVSGSAQLWILLFNVLESENFGWWFWFE